MMREAEKRGGPDGDNLSIDHRALGAGDARPTSRRRSPRRWALGEFETQIDRTLTLTDRKGSQRDLTDDEIERAIAEIQSTIQKYQAVTAS